MKTTFFFTLLLLSFSAVAQSGTTKWFSIKAFLPFRNGSNVTLTVDDQIIHSDTVKKDFYNFIGTVTNKVSRGVLEVSNGPKTVFVPLFIEPGTIKVRDKGHNILEAFNTPTNNTYLDVQKTFDSLSLQAANDSFTSISQYKKSLAKDYIKEHPNSIISLQLINDFYSVNGTANDTTYYALVNMLDKGLKQSSLGKKLAEEAAVRYHTATGRVLPAVNVVDTALKKTALNITGQYTLIHFWASWCLPCRREHPALVSLYKKYNGKGFDIISITVDTAPALWKESIRKDGLVWKHLSDLRGWNGPAARTYGVKSIPASFLVDKNGIIIAKGLTIAELTRTLENLLHPKQLTF